MRMRDQFVVLIVSTLLSSCFHAASGDGPNPAAVNKLTHSLPIDDATSAQVQASVKAFNEMTTRRNAKNAVPKGEDNPAKTLARLETMPANHKIRPTLTDDEMMNAAHLDPNKLRSAEGVEKYIKAWSKMTKRKGKGKDLDEKELLLAAEQARKVMEAKPTMRSRLWTGLKWSYGITVAVVIFIALWAMNE